MKPFFTKRLGVLWQTRLTARFTIVIVITLIAISSITTFISGQLERRSLLARLEEQAARFGDLFAANIATALFTFNHDQVDTLLTGFSSDRMIRFIEVRNSAGKVVAMKGTTDGRSKTVSATREVKYGSERVGKVMIALSTDSIDEALNRYWSYLVVREGLGLLVLCLVIIALVRREISTPIQQVAHGLQDIARGEGDLTKRIENTSNNEIGMM